MAEPGASVIFGPEADGLAGWSAQASPGSRAELSRAGPAPAALRFAFALAEGPSWAIARRELRAEPREVVLHP